jgi:hypothetical protein
VEEIARDVAMLKEAHQKENADIKVIQFLLTFYVKMAITRSFGW